MRERRPADEEAVTEIRREEGGGPPPPWYRENAWLWISLLVLLLVVVGLILAFALTGDGDEEAADTTEAVAVPEVVGLEEDEAIATIEDAGLEVRVQRSAAAAAAAGEVVEQDPAAGADVDRGSLVTITVAQGRETETVTATETVTQTETVTTTQPGEPQTAELPDVTGQAVDDAVAELADAGILASTYPVPGEQEGVVVAQEPDPGTSVPTNDPTSTVRLNVAGQDAQGSVEIPDLTGPPVLEAVVECAQAGLTCRVAVRQAPSSEEVGEVILQEPTAGETVPPWTQVTLYAGR